MFHLKEVGEDLLGLIFPRLCPGCGAHLVTGEKLVCTMCLVSMARTDFHLKRNNILEKSFWGRCNIERAAALSVYNRGSRIRKMVHLLKYSGRRDIGIAMGEYYGNILHGSGFTEGIDLITCVPLDPERERRRGYNQSEYIARGISLSTGIVMRTGVIRRAGVSSSQTSKGRYERWENVKELFSADPGTGLRGSHILLVDDVITTGSTMEACVNALHCIPDIKVSVVALAASQKLTL